MTSDAAASVQAQEPLLDEIAAGEGLERELSDIEALAVVVALADDSAERRGLIVNQMDSDEQFAVGVTELAGTEPHAGAADVDALAGPRSARTAAGIELGEVEVGFEGEDPGRGGWPRIGGVPEPGFLGGVRCVCAA